MDSITQLTLGAAVGQAVLGPRIGRKAALWGGICGTLPDLDVFIPLSDAVAEFTYHRSFSHSLFVLAALTPLLVWLARKIHGPTSATTSRWALAIYAVFATHVLLDAMTIYGTQIFWPISDWPVAVGSVFIIDPAYTVPLLLGLVTALALWRFRRGFAMRANLAGLSVATAYLVWSLGAKSHVQAVSEAALGAQNIQPRQLQVLASPFNTVVWRILVMADEGYYEGWYALTKPNRPIQFRYYESSNELLEGLEDHWPVSRLRWFTKGFYSVTLEDDQVVITDLRMGQEPGYIFRFVVAESGRENTRPIKPIQAPNVRSLGTFRTIWEETRSRL